MRCALSTPHQLIPDDFMEQMLFHLNPENRIRQVDLPYDLTLRIIHINIHQRFPTMASSRLFFADPHTDHAAIWSRHRALNEQEMRLSHIPHDF